jgi:hypothetical protein
MDSTHRCVCNECETERIRQRVQSHGLFQLRSAVAAYLSSAQTYADLAALAYHYRLTMGDPANADGWEP